ncbi:MAG TPA: aldehyde dehydrogenase family protein, partial [Arthrobacter sp.]|nr:aldehyde dehydrogenase family protein [Arthrobacter sp.]
MTYATPSADVTASTLFINGSWEPAVSGAVRHIHNPADGELAATVSEAGQKDAERAIAAARAAFDSGIWSGVPAPERGTFLLRVAAELRGRREKFARAESLDTGKRIAESRIDMDDVAACFEYFGRLAGQQSGRVVDAGDPAVASKIVYEPVGVCGLITPW